MRWLWFVVAIAVLSAIAPRAGAATTPDSLRVLMRSRQYAELVRTARSALLSSHPVSRADSLSAADLADLLAEACWRGRADRPADAESLAADAVLRRERLHGPASFEVARTLPHLARVRRFGGDRQGALLAFQRSLAILERLPERELELATTLVGLGNLQQEMYDHVSAMRTHQRAVEIRTRVLGPNHHETAIALVNLGNTLRDRGETADALLVDSRARGIFESEAPMDTVAVVAATTNVINSHFLLSQEVEALPLCKRFLELARLTSPPGGQVLVNAVEDMAYALAAAGRIEEARRLFAEEIGLLGMVRGATEGDRIRSWRNLGLFEAEHGSADSALVRLERARSGCVTLSRSTPGARASLMILQLDLGKFLLDHGQDSLASLRFTEALQNGSERGLANDHPDMVTARHGLARTLFRRGDMARAFDEACASSLLRSSDERRQYEFLSEAEALRYRRSHVDVTPTLVSLALLRPGVEERRRAYDAAVRAHALVLDAMTFRRRLRADHGDSTSRQLSLELAELVREEARAHLRGPLRSPGDSAFLRRVDLERTLAERNRGLRGDLARRDVGLAEIGARLQQGEALVHYMRLSLHAGWSVRRLAGTTLVLDSTRATWVAWIVRNGDASPELVVLGEGETVDRALARWVEVLDDDAGPRPHIAVSAAHRRGAALRRAIWDPVATLLGDARRVYVVPDGPIYRTPLVTLPGRSGHPLLEVGPEFVLLSSPRDLVRPNDNSTSRGEWLAIADPDFDSASWIAHKSPRLRSAEPCAREPQPRFVRLPGTRDEARSLEVVAKAHGIPVRVLTDAAATIENLEARIEFADGVHVATHGYTIGEDCDSLAQTEDPMLRFGLVLAGANQSHDRAGWMSAAELATLDLGASQLVVISACHSGAGAVLPGEGLFGIARALTLAGARSAVLCTGPIDDEAAAYWMRRFYSHLFDDRAGSAGAVRAAARDLRRRLLTVGRDRPSQWGAFVSLGAPR